MTELYGKGTSSLVPTQRTEERGFSPRALSRDHALSEARRWFVAVANDPGAKANDGDLFSRRVMVIADHASDLPCSVFVLPQMNELAFANSDAVFVSGMVKAMHADFEIAISFH